MNEDLFTKLFIAFCGALIALVLKILFDYINRKIELKRIKLVIESDLALQCHSAAIFIQENQKLYQIYKNALDEYSNARPYNFYEELRSVEFSEVFFSDETFKTIKKSDLLLILEKDQVHFGNIHNIYHISNRLKGRNVTFYENLFDQHLLAFIGDNKHFDNVLSANKLALQFILAKLVADIQTARLLLQMTYDNLSLFIDQLTLKEKFGLEIKKATV